VKTELDNRKEKIIESAEEGNEDQQEKNFNKQEKKKFLYERKNPKDNKRMN